MLQRKSRKVIYYSIAVVLAIVILFLLKNTLVSGFLLSNNSELTEQQTKELEKSAREEYLSLFSDSLIKTVRVEKCIVMRKDKAYLSVGIEGFNLWINEIVMSDTIALPGMIFTHNGKTGRSGGYVYEGFRLPHLEFGYSPRGDSLLSQIHLRYNGHMLDSVHGDKFIYYHMIARDISLSAGKKEHNYAVFSARPLNAFKDDHAEMKVFVLFYKVGISVYTIVGYPGVKEPDTNLVLQNLL